MKIKKILIANRGEIAVRIIRACRELGITPVAVYSEADRSSIHVRMADEAYLIGPAPAVESYLNQEKIIQAAKSGRAEAIHPGYGFLSENAEFIEKVISAGLIFIGPPVKAMRLSGNKLDARRIAEKNGIPTIPGTESTSSIEDAKRSAAKIGYPVVIKAAAGGGGKGMRVVHQGSEMADALRGARHEAASAFGDDRVYMEKYFVKPRHVEVQILADSHGNVIHLGERECSIQRRHQKLVEESPAPNLKPDVRQRITETAVKIARAVGYQNAGTVEFLLDERGDFYFLEINARLQVEHPVTEWVTGLDLAKLQIQIASGEKLPHSQEQIRFSGAAMECRIYAEDFENNFYPSGGKLTDYTEPAGPGVRVDSGVSAGSQISLYYDPLIAKLIVWGTDRQEAIVRMKRALNEYKISGLITTAEFHKRLMENEKFQKGELFTQFLAEEFASEKIPIKTVPKELENLAISAALVEYVRTKPRMDYLPSNGHQPKSNWKTQSRQMALRMPE